MCLAIPMEIIAINEDGSGVVSLDGVRLSVGLMLVEDPQVGEHVLVHAGYAIEKLDTTEAKIRLKLFADLAEAWRNRDGDTATAAAQATGES
ncbi:MAG: HypC/HybG/HupF family hydrogenase formation chaperone [Magnetococcales bacterium]|nr:HypC/HybG/HupF family hydrogenase formation chaperone [Magnetococcales bacterium]